MLWGQGMTSPSPSDLLWVIGFTPQGRWIAPVMRAAVKAEWKNAQYLASAQLGDETLAYELMDLAIDQTKEYLANLSPIGNDEAREILARFYRNAVRRARRANDKFQYQGAGSDLELLQSPLRTATEAVEAGLDLDTILRDTPADLRRAMLMRFGARSQWEEVARETGKSKDAIRMSCLREFNRIRRKLGISERQKYRNPSLRGGCGRKD
jgi:hypothetical protein